ncbi:MAG: hypothetical protein M3M94_04800 [Actinomycetota bacterium]|nr:hypothetical protein [Actinomycetota bacterium]
MKTGEPRPPLERAAAAVERLRVVVARIERTSARLAALGTAAGAVIAYGLLRGGLPRGDAAGVLTVALALLAFAPGGVLFFFSRVLHEVGELPARLRAAPASTRDHLGELARLADRQTKGSRSLRLWRALRVAYSARELMTPYAPLLPLLSLPFLAATALAAAAVVVEVAVAVAVLVVLAVS